MILNRLVVLLIILLIVFFFTFIIMLSWKRNYMNKRYRKKYTEYDTNSNQIANNHNNSKCCLIYEHTCNGQNIDSCKQGIEKRCGIHYFVPCNKTTIGCNYMSNDECKMFPNNIHCTIGVNNKCVNRKGSFGEDIDCNKLNPYISYNQIGCEKKQPSNTL